MELPRADFDVVLQPAVESNCCTQLMELMASIVPCRYMFYTFGKR